MSCLPLTLFLFWAPLPVNLMKYDWFKKALTYNGGGGGGGVSRPSMSACLIESKKDRTGQDIGGHRRT